MKKFFLTIMGLIAVTTSSFAGSIWKGDNKIALGGYDVVAYHTSHAAMRGGKAFSYEYKGDTFYFSSSENKKLFEKNPLKYLPKYDGYCAFAVAKMNKKVPPSPETFKIHNGQLLLFFNDFWEGAPLNTIVPWNQEEEALYSLAEKNWEKLSK